MHSKSEELKKFRSFNGPLIDVRSPNEYYKGHMPNSINIPLFDNHERAIIGTIYKKNARELAVTQGLKIVERKIETLLNSIFKCIDNYKNNNREHYIGDSLTRIYCARGGMRSLSIAWLLISLISIALHLKGVIKPIGDLYFKVFQLTINL